jgi:hypothetical protein
MEATENIVYDENVIYPSSESASEEKTKPIIKHELVDLLLDYGNWKNEDTPFWADKPKGYFVNNLGDKVHTWQAIQHLSNVLAVEIFSELNSEQISQEYCDKMINSPVDFRSYFSLEKQRKYRKNFPEFTSNNHGLFYHEIMWHWAYSKFKENP